MTLSTLTSRVSYLGTGSTGPFAIPFRFLATADLLVTKRSAAGTETALALTTHYTVTGANEATGNLTLVTALAAGETLVIRRKPAITQPTSIRNQGAYYPATIEDEFDRLAMQLQGLKDELDRSLKLKETVNGGASLTELEPTAGKVVAGTGTGFTMSTLDSSAVALPGAGRTVLTLSAYLANNAAFNLKDYSAVLNGVADDSTPIQAALDSGGGDIDLPVGDALLLKPLLIKSGTARVMMRGRNRVRSLLIPGAVDIKQAAQNVNALIINQDNNSHFCLNNLRFHGAVAYTGVVVYCKEGGCADGSGQALFSALFKDLWLSLASPNGGFLTGATNNSVFDTVTAESMKGIFTIEGVGNNDNSYRAFSLVSCYDHFIKQTADTNGSSSITVDGLHAYAHQRGRLFDCQNWINCLIRGVILEPLTGNLGDTGLFKFKDSSGLIVSDFTALKRTGVPACAVGIEVEATSAKFTAGKINAAVAFKISGTGAIDVDVENVDFTDCDTYCMHIVAAATGTLRTRNCKFNNSQFDCMYAVANAMNWYSYDDEFLNAGLGGNASTRNLTLNSSGTIVLTRPRIGRDNGSAAAAYFVNLAGSGTVELVDPIWVGTPPTARFTGSQPVTIRVTPPSGYTTVTDATYTVLESDASIIANRAGTVTLTLPSAGNYPGRRLTVRTIQAQTVVSASSNVVPRAGGAAGAAILAATAGAWAELESDGTNWQTMSGS